MTDLMAAVSAALEAVVDAPVIGEVRADEPLWPQEALAGGWLAVDVLEELPLGLVQVSVAGPDAARVDELEASARRVLEVRADGSWVVPLAGVELRAVAPDLCQSAALVVLTAGAPGPCWMAQVGWRLWGVR